MRVLNATQVHELTLSLPVMYVCGLVSAVSMDIDNSRGLPGAKTISVPLGDNLP
jgi:hypothetical protein